MQQTWLVREMQIEQFGLVDFHVLDVGPNDFVCAFDVIVTRREVKVALGEIGATDNQVLVSPDEQDGCPAREPCHRVQPKINCHQRLLLVAFAVRVQQPHQVEH